MIRISDGQLRLGGDVIFSQLSWRIDIGRHIGLVGPNGAGKTSLLRVLVGEYSLESGTLETSKNLRIGYLPQDSTELPDRKISEILMEAFTSLNLMEREMHGLLETIQSTDGKSPEHERTIHRYGTLQEAFQKSGGYSRESDAKKVFIGLGFQHSDWNRPANELSGGWRMRLFLAKILLENPDILLLDEPTNHLDADALEWFEQYLTGSASGLVIVSHDRYLLDRTVTEIAEIERGRFRTYTGNYSKYRKLREEIREQLLAQKRNQDREIAHLESFIERFKAKNTKASQAQSRIKRLEKMERIEVETDSNTVSIPLPQIPRSGKEVLILEEMGHCYDNQRALFPHSVTLYRGDRIAVWGPNGAGKSTLLSILGKKLVPSEGLVKWGYNTHIAYFSQHHSELQNSRNTILDELAAAAPDDMQTRLRDVLACFLFRGDEVFKSVSVCSGGEKSRLALAKLLISPVNVLILDEPLNHLDISTVETFEEALQRFQGTIVFVSHDRFFVERLATQVWEMKAGHIERYKGNFSDYEYAKLYREERTALDDTDRESEIKTGRQQRKEKKRKEAEERNRIGALRREHEQKCDALEREIHKIEREIEEIEVNLASTDFVRDPKEMSRLSKRRKKLLKIKEKRYENWEKLVDSFEIA